VPKLTLLHRGAAVRFRWAPVAFGQAPGALNTLREEKDMAGFAVKRIDEMEAAFLGAFKRARAELGVEAFGMQVMDLPPHLEQFPEHDHAQSGQEEVYVVMSGRGELDVEGERVAIDPDTIVRVGPDARRKIYTGEEGARVLALGGTPGRAYEAPKNSQIGVEIPLPSST
jgi:mannose-6-phosphate isomerase-like protein (cupin superfamily)